MTEDRLRRGADDHETAGGPYATLYGTYGAIKVELIRLADLGVKAPNQHDELLDAVRALDRGDPEVRVGHCRMIRTDTRL